MAQQRAGIEGSGGGKKPTRGSTSPLDAAIKAAKSVDDLAKMGLKIVTAPINKGVDIASGAVKGAVSGAIKGAKGAPQTKYIMRSRASSKTMSKKKK